MTTFKLSRTELVRSFDVTGASPIGAGPSATRPQRMEVTFINGTLSYVEVHGCSAVESWHREVYTDECGQPLADVPADLRPATDIDFQP